MPNKPLQLAPGPVSLSSAAADRASLVTAACRALLLRRSVALSVPAQLNGGTLGGQMSRSHADIVELVRAGALEAIAALSSDPDDPLLTFALCTDDDVSGVFHVGCTARFARTSEFPDVRFQPNDFEQRGGGAPEALEIVSDEFQRDDRRPKGPAWAQARDADFHAMAEGLAAARATGIIPDSVFLTVMSTDPSDHMSSLEEDWLPRLNATEVLRLWQRWRLDCARSWLSDLQARPAPLSYGDQYRIECLQLEVQRFEELLSPDAPPNKPLKADGRTSS